MRYFLAIPLPEEVKQKLHSMNVALSGFKGLRFVSPDNMHLTLLFLGDNGAVNKISELKNIVFKSFKLKASGISLFPDDGKIRLVWVDLKESVELDVLQKKVSKLFGIDNDYRPHITLARVKNLDKKERGNLINKVKNIDFPDIVIDVKNFKLYSSELTVLGPVHRVIEYFEADLVGKK